MRSAASCTQPLQLRSVPRGARITRPVIVVLRQPCVAVPPEPLVRRPLTRCSSPPVRFRESLTAGSLWLISGASPKPMTSRVQDKRRFHPDGTPRDDDAPHRPGGPHRGGSCACGTGRGRGGAQLRADLETARRRVDELARGIQDVMKDRDDFKARVNRERERLARGGEGTGGAGPDRDGGRARPLAPVGRRFPSGPGRAAHPGQAAAAAPGCRGGAAALARAPVRSQPRRGGGRGAGLLAGAERAWCWRSSARPTPSGAG